MNARHWVVASATIGLFGCASVKPEKPRAELDQLVEQRVGVKDAVSAQQDEESQERVRARVNKLLEKPLTVERAVQVALLNNRNLHAVMEDLGIAQADLVQAGLLENPVLAGDLVFSTTGNGPGGGLSLTASLLSVFLIPAKVRLAKSQLAHTVVKVGQTTLMLVRDVRVAYANAKAAQAVLHLQRFQSQAAEAAYELIQLQFEAGNVSPLDVRLFAAAQDEARVELGDAQTAAFVAKEEVTRLLGLWGAQTSWSFAEKPDSTLPTHPAFDQLEQQGIRDRLDISAQRAVVKSIEYAIKLRRRGLIPQVNGGVEARNEVGDDAGHEWVLGPSLSIELPIFDPGHADFARLRAQLRQAQHRLQGASIVARSEIRSHREQLVAARQKVEYYQQTVLPRAENIRALTLERYNAMLVGTYQLLETRAGQLRQQRESFEALRDYWIARSELELAVGGRLPAPPQEGVNQ